MRIRHPNLRILQKKEDMDAAYRRIHASALAACLVIAILEGIAYILTRLPFGSTPAPSLFSIISDSITDIIQDLTTDPTWDPKSFPSSVNEADEPPLYLPNDVPLGKANELSVPLPPRDIVTDDYIDDIIQAGIATEDIILKMHHAIPLVLESVIRQIHPDDASKRDPIISARKHAAEGHLEEQKTVLGWLVDSRRLQLYLPEPKAKDWLFDIDECISNSRCSKEKLESIIGRLNHVGTIIHLSRYFLSRLRYRLQKNNKKWKKASIYLKPWEIEDLKLWKFFLTHLSTKGVSFNNVCFTKPSHITYSDACEWGLGGYTMNGTAWRFEIPEHLRLRASINLLEFMAAIITIKMSLLHDPKSPFPRFLSFTDSSSALGWLYHSTFNPVNQPQHDKVARYFATTLFEADATLHPVHIPGKANIIADSLSRDFHVTDDALTSFLLSPSCTSLQHPSQIPESLAIKSVPKELTSWIASTLESLSPSKESLPTPSSSTLLLSNFGQSSSSEAKSHQVIHSSNDTMRICDPLSSSALPTVSDTTTTREPRKPPLQVDTSLPPCQMWFRYSGTTFGLTPHATPQENEAPSSPSKSKRIRI
jgi:hypothetical protein